MSGTVVALIATGAAVGAAGALAARRRNRVKWSEYEPSELHSDAKDLLESSSTATTSLSPSAEEMGQPGMIKKAGGWTKNTYDSVRHKIHEATADHPATDDAVGMANDTAADMADEARGSVRKANEGSSHFGDKAKDKLNETSSRAGDSVNRTGERAGDSVDDLLRSSKNGRM